MEVTLGEQILGFLGTLSVWKSGEWGVQRIKEKNGNVSTKTKKAVEHLEEKLVPQMTRIADTQDRTAVALDRLADSHEDTTRALQDLKTTIAVLNDRVHR